MSNADGVPVEAQKSPQRDGRAVMRRQFIRYCIIGVVHNGAGYLLYLLVTWLGAEPKIAMSVLFVIGVAVSFLLNRNWSFADKGSVSGSLTRFVIVYLTGYGLNLAALLVFFDRLGYPHQWVQGIATITIAVVLFLLNRYVVFRDARQAR